MHLWYGKFPFDRFFVFYRWRTQKKTSMMLTSSIEMGNVARYAFYPNEVIKKRINFNIKNYESSLNYRIYSITRRPRIDAALEWTPQHDAVFNRIIDSETSQWSMLRSQMEIWTTKWTDTNIFECTSSDVEKAYPTIDILLLRVLQ